MARIRSPNYPQVSILDAVEDVRVIHQKEAQHFAPRDVVANHLGYSTVNGASEKKTSALNAYGLIERNTDREIRVSGLAMRILFPQDDAEKREALAEAALSPKLFRELREKWPTNAPSNESLRAYLIRQGFNQNAVDQVIAVYRDALSTVFAPEVQTADDDSDKEAALQSSSPKASAPLMPSAPRPATITNKPIVFDMETISGQYSFDNADDLADFIQKLERIRPLLPPKGQP